MKERQMFNCTSIVKVGGKIGVCKITTSGVDLYHVEVLEEFNSVVEAQIWSDIRGFVTVTLQDLNSVLKIIRNKRRLYGTF